MSKHGRDSKRQDEVLPLPVLGGGMDPRSGPEASPLSTHEPVAVRAYGLWESRGRPEGDGRQDWFEALRQLSGVPVIETGIDHTKSGEAHPKPERGGKPQRTHEMDAEQAREARESEEARRAGPSNRERMVDIGRGNQQAGRQTQ